MTIRTSSSGRKETATCGWRRRCDLVKHSDFLIVRKARVAISEAEGSNSARLEIK